MKLNAFLELEHKNTHGHFIWGEGRCEIFLPAWIKIIPTIWILAQVVSTNAQSKGGGRECNKFQSYALSNELQKLQWQ